LVGLVGYLCRKKGYTTTQIGDGRPMWVMVIRWDKLQMILDLAYQLFHIKELDAPPISRINAVVF
jgi:hypothetical protein